MHDIYMITGSFCFRERKLFGHAGLHSKILCNTLNASQTMHRGNAKEKNPF